MKDQINPLSVHKSQQGFSLLEVGIIVAIIGLLITPFIIQYNNEMMVNKSNNTRTNITTASSALEKYALKYGRYPKPANPSLASNERRTISGIQYGSGDEQPNQFSVPAATAYPACPTDPAVSQTSVCQTQGVRDADGVGGNDLIYIGTLPFAAIGLNESQSIDGFGNKLRYVVTANQTRPPPPDFNRDLGVLRIEDDTGAASDSAGNSTAHYIIISHGAEGRGAYNLAGTQTIPCGPTTVRRDHRNCDYDGVFDDGSISYNVADPDTGVITSYRVVTKQNNTTAQAWDNYYAYSAGSSTTEWVPAANSNNLGTMDVESVRINTALRDDRVRVEVGGDVRSEKLYTDRICGFNSADNTCVDPLDIGRDTAPAARPNPATDRPGIRCAAFSAMTGIAAGNEDCGTLTSTNLGTFVLTPCPAGEYPNGITATGERTCRAP
jgi:Tfp pilus assembly protein PilE